MSPSTHTHTHTHTHTRTHTQLHQKETQYVTNKTNLTHSNGKWQKQDLYTICWKCRTNCPLNGMYVSVIILCESFCKYYVMRLWLTHCENLKCFHHEVYYVLQFIIWYWIFSDEGLPLKTQIKSLNWKKMDGLFWTYFLFLLLAFFVYKKWTPRTLFITNVTHSSQSHINTTLNIHVSHHL